MSTTQGNTQIPRPAEAGQPSVASIPMPEDLGNARDPAPLTPPPPSAPGEFLSAQWVEADGKGVSKTTSRSTLTPPPPSAPGEFLEAQWRDETAPELDAPQPAEDAFELALAPALNSTEDLDRLQAEESVPEEELDEAPVASGAIPAADRVRIRGVSLKSGETVSRVFLPNDGLAEQVPPSGQALILTSQRLIAFRGVEGYRDTHIAWTSEITQSSVRTGQRNWGAALQGLMIIIGGAILYLIVGYWLAGQISGPRIPALNIDVAPFIALLIILAGVFILLQNYFTRPAGAMIFRGEGVEIAFPFRSSLDVGQAYDFVDLAHEERRRFNEGIDR